jgi:hypothetical protein
VGDNAMLISKIFIPGLLVNGFPIPDSIASDRHAPYNNRNKNLQEMECAR